ncbi:MAG: PIN domain-containing protein [Candidatus Hydrogenedentota bacterium]
MTYVTDTHSLIWFLENNRRLSERAEAVFRDDASSVIVPTIVLAEIRFLRAKKRIRITHIDVMEHVAASSKTSIHPLDEKVIDLLPETLEMHDAIIVATAVLYRDSSGEPAAVVTKDSQIRASGLIDTVW